MFFDIPNKDGLWVYNSPMVNVNQGWQTWVKPTQYNNFIIYMCGGGGGGGCGNNNTVSGFNLGGGGGGAGGVLTTINTPSYLLPETLYINIGRGGAGGFSGGAGTAGAVTYLNYFPNTNTANTILISSGGNGGAAGQQNAAGAGGATSTGPSTQSIFSYAATNSSAGTAGGLNGNGIDFSITTCCIYGGTGGGNKNAANTPFTGGNILASNIHPQLNGGAIDTVGNNGYFIKKPFTALGGTGGGGSASTNGGKGGDGIMGSGGGGGGAFVGLATGDRGRGGRGGDGFVIIIGY